MTEDGTVVGPGDQSSVDSHFTRSASFWDEIYRDDDVYGVIHQQRRERVLAWVDRLSPPVGAHALDAGCGAGLTAVALAERGLRVCATDSVPSMLDRARRNVVEGGVEGRVEVTRADVHALPFQSGDFELVVALGVIPWLHSPEAAVRELARVTRPGGTVIVTADNRARLNYRLDPRLDPRLTRVREGLKHQLARLGRPPGATGVVPTLHAISEVDAMLARAGLGKLEGQTLGFGPFTLLGRPAVPNRLGARIHERLQARADRGDARLASRGSQYIVLARREAEPH